MSKTISANELDPGTKSLLTWITSEQDNVLIENDGAPKFAIIPIEQFEEYQALREKRRREEILEDLRKLREEVRARNQDLSEEEAWELANRFSHEIVEDMVAEGKIRYDVG